MLRDSNQVFSWEVSKTRRSILVEGVGLQQLVEQEDMLGGEGDFGFSMGGSCRRVGVALVAVLLSWVACTCMGW